MKKKVIIIILFLAIAVFYFAKFYPKKIKNIEIKSESPSITDEQENIASGANTENPEFKAEENKNDTAVDAADKTKKDIPQTSGGDTNELNISNKLVSWGYEKTDTRKIDTIIIHSSYNALGGDEYDLEKLINEYKEYGVSPHYLIDRKGKIYRLVADKNIAYHAGESRTPDGRSSVNNFSIGVELMNTEDDKYTSEQYSALKKLIADLKSGYKIKYVLGHNQIATGRKTDPWNFDWSKI